MEEVLGVVAPVPKGEWNNATGYEVLNIVRYNNTLYMAKQDVPANIAPTVAANWTNYWMLLISPLTATDIVNEIYPVGSIYLSTDNASPAVKYGGTWEQITDTFLLAASDINEASPTYSGGDTGGSADAVVVSHNHYTDFSWGYAANGDSGHIGENDNIQVLVKEIDVSRMRRYDTSSFGQSKIGKNMPPYLVVYVWKRIG